MYTLLVFVHVIVSIFLVIVVLLQTGKGAEMGAGFGGASQTLFGSRGAMDFMEKLTTVAAVLFMITSLSLAFLSSRGTSAVPGRQPAPVQEQLPAPITGTGEQGPSPATK